MSGKYIVGGVAAAGVAYYVYENKKLQQEVHQPKSWTGTKYNELKGETVGAKIDNNLSSLQKTTDKKTAEAKSWADDKSKDLKKWGDEKSKEANKWATEKQKDGEAYWKNTGKPLLKDKVEDSKVYFDRKIDEANREIGNSTYINNDPNKSTLLKAGDAYIDTVNNAAFAVHDGLYSIKDSIFGRSKTDDLKKQAEEAKKETGSWFGDKFNKAQDKKDEIASSNKKSWFNFKDDDSSGLTDASRGFGENSTFWAKEEEEQRKLATTLKETKDSVVDSVQNASDSTLATLGSAKDILNKKTSEASEQVNDASEKAKPWFGLKTVDQRDEEKLDRLIAEVSRGYGENATFFAKESYDDIANKPVLIQELRDKAASNLKEAKENLDKTKSSWWKWASAKDKEAEKIAKEQWENAQVFYDDVEKRLVQGNETFKQWTDAAISGTKNGLNYANEKTQDGLNGAQKWIRGEKK